MTPQEESELNTLMKELENNNEELIKLAREHDRIYNRIKEIYSNEEQNLTVSKQ